MEPMMATAFATETTGINATLQLLRDTRARTLSRREWQHVLRGYGFDLRRTLHGTTLVKLPHNQEICELPADLCA
ncbi:MAG TPA: hypothetical protein DEF12_14290 [Rhodobacteraceae bacterium]|jgi:hypothetical protein|nr:hypothetical protein [Paracoccaceae bacterium]